MTDVLVASRNWIKESDGVCQPRLWKTNMSLVSLLATLFPGPRQKSHGPAHSSLLSHLRLSGSLLCKLQSKTRTIDYNSANNTPEFHVCKL